VFKSWRFEIHRRPPFPQNIRNFFKWPKLLQLLLKFELQTVDKSIRTFPTFLMDLIYNWFSNIYPEVNSRLILFFGETVVFFDWGLGCLILFWTEPTQGLFSIKLHWLTDFRWDFQINFVQNRHNSFISAKFVKANYVSVNTVKIH
jgi:hypothetical protein